MNRSAPDFPELQWFGCAQPPRHRRDLEGQVVVLAFWTPTCVHSRQLLRDLAFLEQRFSDRTLAVLSVLGARHPSERDPAAALRAIQRLQILHPVAHDPDARFWKTYECQAWPTLVVIDASGDVRYSGRGEPKLESVVTAIDALLGEAEAAGSAAPEPLRNDPERDDPAATGLCSPTRLCFDSDAGLLWIADTGHHRLLGVDPDSGVPRHVAGSGMVGDADGSLEDACFWFPSGMAVLGERLLVADTGNHRLRAVHPGSGQVESLAGTGRRGRDVEGGRFGLGQELHSPQDLCVHDGTVYLAMAGTHQLWAFDPDTGAVRALFGTGVQGQRDGDAAQARLSQPAGLAAEAAELLLSDSGHGALRAVDLDHMVVHTLSGRGTGGAPALYFPQAVAVRGGDALVADPARHRVVRVDRSSGTVTPLVGPDDGLRSPEGVAVHGDRLWIADTGNHRILSLDLKQAGAAPRQLELRDVPDAAMPFADVARKLPEVTLQQGEGVAVKVRMQLPPGTSPHPDCPVLLRIRDPGGSLLANDVDQTAELQDEFAVLDWLPLAGGGSGELHIELRYQSWRDPATRGHRHALRCHQPVKVAADGRSELVIG